MRSKSNLTDVLPLLWSESWQSAPGTSLADLKRFALELCKTMDMEYTYPSRAICLSNQLPLLSAAEANQQQQQQLGVSNIDANTTPDEQLPVMGGIFWPWRNLASSLPGNESCWQCILSYLLLHLIYIYFPWCLRPSICYKGKGASHATLTLREVHLRKKNRPSCKLWQEYLDLERSLPPATKVDF